MPRMSIGSSLAHFRRLFLKTVEAIKSIEAPLQDYMARKRNLEVPRGKKRGVSDMTGSE